MYNKFKSRTKTSNLKGEPSYKAETIEEKVRRILNNKEPISDGAPLVYTDRKDGVIPQTNIRHDKWESAVEQAEVAKSLDLAKRQFKQGERTFDTMTKEEQAAHIKKFPDSKFNRKSEA